MKKIIGVRFKKLGKIYFFNPENLNIKKGDKVIVETAQGEEYAEVLIANRIVDDDKNCAPLKKVLRIATNKMILSIMKIVRKKKRKHLMLLLKK